MITKNNLIKKLIGMTIFQTAIILFFVSVGVKTDSGHPDPQHAATQHEFHEVDPSTTTSTTEHPEELPARSTPTRRSNPTCTPTRSPTS